MVCIQDRSIETPKVCDDGCQRVHPVLNCCLPCRYHLVAIDFLQPPPVGWAMKRVAAAVMAGRLGALPFSCSDLSKAGHAMRLMSQV